MKNRSGYFVGWYENGKRKSKALPNKALAQHFSKLQYQRLNDDVFTGVLKTTWSTAVSEYKKYKQSKKLRESSLYQVMHTLDKYTELTRPTYTTDFTTRSIENFRTMRLKDSSEWTVNKDIANLRSFATWAIDERMVDSKVRLEKVEAKQKQVRILSSQEIKRLLEVVRPKKSMYIRVLLAISTGLRREDIQGLKCSDIHLKEKYIATYSDKTGKSTSRRPIPSPIVPVLKEYMESLEDDRLLPHNFTHLTWKKYRQKAKLDWLKFHDLRKVFASQLAGQGVNQKVVQRLLEHSTIDLTSKVYTQVDDSLADAIESLPVNDWL